MSDFIEVTHSKEKNDGKFMINLDHVAVIQKYTGKMINDLEAKTRIIMSIPDGKNSNKMEVYYIKEEYEMLRKEIFTPTQVVRESTKPPVKK